MSVPNEVNPYEPPRHVTKSRFALYLFTGLTLVVLTGGTIAFLAWRSARDSMVNLDRAPVFYRGPIRESLPPIGPQDAMAAESPAPPSTQPVP